MKKRGIVTDYLMWILIAVAFLAIVIISIALTKEKGLSIIDSIKNLLTGR